MNSDFESNKFENNDDLNFDDIDFKQIFSSIKRRKRFILSISTFIFLCSAIYTAHQRIFKPTYIGSFKLLILLDVSLISLLLKTWSLSNFFTNP